MSPQRRYTGNEILNYVYYGTRIEAASIMKEFTDRLPFGTGVYALAPPRPPFLLYAVPEGSLFYYGIQDLDVNDTATKYSLFHNGLTDEQRAITI